MWLITNFGYFSVVEKPGDRTDGQLTVRARVRDDLEALRTRYLPDLGPIQADAGTDYKYRARVSRNALANAAARIVADIDYGNFKSSVQQQQGSDRYHVYGQVWSALNTLQETRVPPAPPAALSRALALAYGGVVCDDDGRVLLCEPAGHFDGYVWTFPKGRGRDGESSIEVALREVLEETGYRARVIGRIPQLFVGSTSETIYYLMRPHGQRTKPDARETQSIRWATPAEARALIAQTTNPVGRRRDLAVLEAAIVELDTYDRPKSER